MLYCTGIRFGEALRLRMCDVNTRSDVLFIETFKGRARWVPFHRTLSSELDRYVADRVGYAACGPETRFFVGINRQRLPVGTAHSTLHRLFDKAGLTPHKGGAGPRPYDLRHAFAVERLTRWYREGVDLQARLPLLSHTWGMWTSRHRKLSECHARTAGTGGVSATPAISEHSQEDKTHDPI